jgi:hypothetical protein
MYILYTVYNLISLKSVYLHTWRLIHLYTWKLSLDPAFLSWKPLKVPSIRHGTKRQTSKTILSKFLTLCRTVFARFEVRVSIHVRTLLRAFGSPRFNWYFRVYKCLFRCIRDCQSAAPCYTLYTVCYTTQCMTHCGF